MTVLSDAGRKERGRRRQEGARAKVVLRRQRLRAEVLEASLLAIVGDLRSESPPVR